MTFEILHTQPSSFIKDWRVVSYICLCAERYAFGSIYECVNVPVVTAILLRGIRYSEKATFPNNFLESYVEDIKMLHTFS